MDESARSDPQRDYSHSATLFRSLSLIALAGHAIILIAMTIVQIRPLVIINVLSVALYGGAIVLNRRRLYVAVLAVGLVEVTAHAIVATFILGWDSGFHVYLLTLLPLVFFFDPWPVRVRVTVSLERVRAVRASQSFSLGLVDVDHFKRVNDEHGHSLGDVALQSV
ncbi:MAG: diguanylate cyclase domain-containing protein, partial [Spirochaetota bacterium]